jgi:hypothetical protein
VVFLEMKSPELCSFDGVSITPYHPIHISLDKGAEGEWIFPKDIWLTKCSPDDMVTLCDVVLAPLKDGSDARPTVYISSRPFTEKKYAMEVATWGHGLNGPVIEHAFFGNRQAVLRALDRAPTETPGIHRFKCGKYKFERDGKPDADGHCTITDLVVSE